MFKISAFCGLAAAFIAATSQAFYIQHQASTSQYIHSNDTIEMTLSSRTANSLFGASGSVHDLEFVVVNTYTGAHFTFNQHSEDNFMGALSTTEAYLQKGQQQTVIVRGMTVPQRPEGAKIKFTLTVERDSGYSKREAPPGSDGRGSSGSGGRPPVNNPNDNYPNNNYPSFDDPSYRRELSITVEFTVTSELKDSKDPWIQLSYLADDKGDTCTRGPKDAGCENELWWTKYKIQDEQSGLHLIQFTPTGGSFGSPDDSIYYRYDNFPIGTDKEYEVVAAATCCVEGLMMRVTDVAGNQEEVVARNGGTGTPMSKGLMWGLIGGGIVVALIIIGVIAYCCKNKYSSVPSN